MEGERRKDNDVRALLQQCADTLLSAVTQLGSCGNRGCSISLSSSINEPNINGLCTLSSTNGTTATTSTRTTAPTRFQTLSSHTSSTSISSTSTSSCNRSCSSNFGINVPTTPLRQSVIAEHQRLFNFQPSTNNSVNFKSNGRKRQRISGKPTKPMWNHAVVCLPSTDWEHVPTFTEKANLALRGLGEKKLVFHLMRNLMKQFYVSFRPWLKEVGSKFCEVVGNVCKSYQCSTMDIQLII